MNRQFHLLLLWISLAWCGVGRTEQLPITRVEMMPNIPSPFVLKDWKATAQAYDALVYDFSATGDYQPIPWWDTTHINVSFDIFGMPSYVGAYNQTGGSGHESINVLASVLGATLVGIDKSNQNGTNFVRMAEGYYNTASGEGLVLNLTYTDSGNTFWYEVYPHVLFYQLVHYYPSVGNLQSIMLDTANKWYTAEYFMGGKTGVPDFNHTAFDFDSYSAVDNGSWKEPDAAAGIAWLQYMAYMKFGQSKFLTGADWGMQFLEAQTENPYYEALMPHGVYVAARMNAEQGRNYNVGKFINWCFDVSTARPGWGTLTGSWNGYEVNGLAGSITTDYAFAMNTFNLATALVPLVRYDERFARAVGKWMLNAAVNTRYFYADAVPLTNQSTPGWAEASQGVVAYEGFRKIANPSVQAVADHSTAYGSLQSGSFASTFGLDNQYEILREEVSGSTDRLQHIWRFEMPGVANQWLRIYAQIVDGGDADNGFVFSYSPSPSGPWTDIFTVTSTAQDVYWTGVGTFSGPLYLKAEDTSQAAGNTGLDTLKVNVMRWHYDDASITPFATGDPIDNGWGATDFGLYGSSQVGVFGGLIEPTNNDNIIQLDLLKTDFFGAQAYPSYLYYNPHGTFAWVNIDVGVSPVDLYDAVSNTFLRQDAVGLVNFQVPADGAVVLVLPPANGTVTYDGSKTLIGGVIVDYQGEPLPVETAARAWENIQ